MDIVPEFYVRSFVTPTCVIVIKSHDMSFMNISRLHSSIMGMIIQHGCLDSCMISDMITNDGEHILIFLSEKPDVHNLKAFVNFFETTYGIKIKVSLTTNSEFVDRGFDPSWIGRDRYALANIHAHIEGQLLRCMRGERDTRASVVVEFETAPLRVPPVLGFEGGCWEQLPAARFHGKSGFFYMYSAAPDPYIRAATSDLERLPPGSGPVSLGDATEYALCILQEKDVLDHAKLVFCFASLEDQKLASENLLTQRRLLPVQIRIDHEQQMIVFQKRFISRRAGQSISRSSWDRFCTRIMGCLCRAYICSVQEQVPPGERWSGRSEMDAGVDLSKNVSPLGKRGVRM